MPTPDNYKTAIIHLDIVDVGTVLYGSTKLKRSCDLLLRHSLFFFQDVKLYGGKREDFYFLQREQSFNLLKLHQWGCGKQKLLI